MTQTQMVLELSDEASEVPRAFDDGRLYLLVDTPVRSSGHRDSGVCGGNAADADGMVTWVHVISRPAGGEVRGYARVGGELRLRLPAYPLEWHELDAEVLHRIGCARVVAP
ncbi:hypothetical protein [Myxococcus eversor]|uniref:hypothetical protein n=1 Tax=Myxococcus eversor TaxID=2709661 RepID=UPI0013D52C02|nr:hypothetical protein [Myxococcus eversor]